MKSAPESWRWFFTAAVFLACLITRPLACLLVIIALTPIEFLWYIIRGPLNAAWLTLLSGIFSIASIVFTNWGFSSPDPQIQFAWIWLIPAVSSVLALFAIPLLESEQSRRRFNRMCIVGVWIWLCSALWLPISHDTHLSAENVETSSFGIVGFYKQTVEQGVIVGRYDQRGLYISLISTVVWSALTIQWWRDCDRRRTQDWGASTLLAILYPDSNERPAGEEEG